MQQHHFEPNRAFPARTAAILFGESAQTQHLSSLAELVGYGIITPHAENDVGVFALLDASPDLLLIELRSNADHASPHLPHIARYLNSSNAEALVWTDMEGLDTAFAALAGTRSHFLVDANESEALLLMSGIYRRGKMERLHDSSRDQEFGALHRISDELADFARTLAKLAEQEGNPSSGGVRDRPVSFQPAPQSALLPLSSIGLAVERPTHQPPISAPQLREIIKLRRLRDQFFNADLFADPAWDIMLDLYAAGMEGRQVSVSSLCIAASVPPTTALRWITSMTDNGLLTRKQDPHDARRVFIMLSEATLEKLDSYFREAGKRSISAI